MAGDPLLAEAIAVVLQGQDRPPERGEGLDRRRGANALAAEAIATERGIGSAQPAPNTASIDVRVTRRRTRSFRRILPLAITIPALLGALVIALRPRRRG